MAQARRGGPGILVNAVLAWSLVPVRVRWRLLRALGCDIQPSTIASSCWFGGTAVSIGRGTFVNRECFFDSSAQVALGDNVSVGMRVTFVTGTHEIGGSRKRAGERYARAITVENGAWIGAGCLILPGVTIGTGSVIAAGSVVTSDCEANSLYAGVPARRIKSL